jgi:hypothetical protein
VRPSVAINLRAELRSRIARALQDKCPKLQSCKSSGAISVLILETRDSASNHWQLAEEFVPELSNRSDTPDYIFLVDTLTTRWFVLPLKMRSELIPDTAAIKFNPNELTDVTSGSRFLVR